ncbi:hypothetical protein D3C86_1889590 [compost metagenome]
MLGDPRARGAQRQQASQRAGVLGQQHQVRRTTGHGLNQWQHPFQHQVGIGVLHGLRQQSRDEGIQALAPQALHGAQLRAAAQAGQGFQRLGGIGETALFQLTAGRFFVLGFFP